MRLIILVILGYLLYRLLRVVFAPGKKLQRRQEGGAIDEMVQDPFCQTYIPMRESQRRIVNGREYFFCSQECADQFEKQRTG